MKKPLLTLVLISLVLFVNGQPTLNHNTVIPYIGQVFPMYSEQTYDPGSHGANQTWDYTHLSTSTSLTQSVVDPSGTPQGANFPTATFAFTINNGAGGYEYIQVQNGNMLRLGAAASGFLMECDVPGGLLQFPLTYQDTYQGSYECVLDNFMAGQTYYRTSNFTGEATGYGTLELDGRSFSDVLQIKVNEDLRDSTTVAGSPFIFTGTTETYVYYSASHQHFLLSTSRTDYFGQIADQTHYREPNSVFVEELTQPVYAKVFPNPASDLAYIQVDLKETQDVVVQVMNAQGVLVDRMDAGNLRPGRNTFQLNTESWGSGMYWINIVSASQTVTLPLVVTE